jgi:hypothetical protein
MRKREQISDLFNARYSFEFREVRRKWAGNLVSECERAAHLLYVLRSSFKSHLGTFLGSSWLMLGERPTVGHNELLALPSIC